MAYLFIALPLVVGLVLLAVVAIRLRRALRRFGMVRGWLEDYLSNRTGMLRARSAALAVAVAQVGRGGIDHAPPRTIDSSLEPEDYRA